MQNRVRILANIMLDTDRNGVVSRDQVDFGTLLPTEYVQISDDPEFVDIHLSDGGVIRGINKTLIEIHGVEVKEYQETNPVIELEPTLDTDL